MRKPLIVRSPTVVRIVATKVEPEHLKSGDLFSDHGPEYWSVMDKLPEVGIFIRTNCMDVPESDHEAWYRLTIVINDENNRSESTDAHIRKAEVSPFAPPGMSFNDWNKKPV